MITLPRSGQARDEARQEMLGELRDPLTIVLLVRGDGANEHDFAARAEALAHGRRRVMHVTDPSVLTAAETERWFGDDAGEDVVGAVLRTSGDRCGRVLQGNQSSFNIENAFLDCEAGGS